MKLGKLFIYNKCTLGGLFMGFHTKPTTFVGHVKIKVENLERSLNFIKMFLGLIF